MFGAGHLACIFINLFGLKDILEFVVDDNVHKRGLFMPGSLLSIHHSSELIKENIKLCFLGISPLSEARVIQNNQEFIKKGGEFISIFPDSKFSFKTLGRLNF